MSPSVQAATRDRWPVSAALGSARMRVRAAAASSRAELSIIKYYYGTHKIFSPNPSIFNDWNSSSKKNPVLPKCCYAFIILVEEKNQK